MILLMEAQQPLNKEVNAMKKLSKAKLLHSSENLQIKTICKMADFTVCLFNTCDSYFSLRLRDS